MGMGGNSNTDPLLVKYIAFEAIEDGTFSFTKDGLSYSLDGDTWSSLTANTPTPTIVAGSKIYFKGNLSQAGNGYDGIGLFSSTNKFNAMGNVASLTYGDNAEGTTSLKSGYVYSRLFKNCINLVNASGLVMSATTLEKGCYYEMFYGCTSLENAPNLLAETLPQYCYRSMFQGCTSLVNTPLIGAVTAGMQSCDSMFYGCTSLVNSCELNVTTTAERCFQNMFLNCSSLVNAPSILPAKTLTGRNTYGDMFSNCTSLEIAPILPATELITYCYYGMFYNCSRLRYVKMLATTNVGSGYTDNWLANVASTGTFVKNAAANWQVAGHSGIPNNWTVETETVNN